MVGVHCRFAIGLLVLVLTPVFAIKSHVAVSALLGCSGAGSDGDGAGGAGGGGGDEVFAVASLCLTRVEGDQAHCVALFDSINTTC